MKKSLSIVAAALSLVMVVACGPRQNGKAAKAEAEKSQAELQAEQLIKIHLDSLASELVKVNPIGIVGSVKDGKIVLSDAEKLVKPEYLADAAVANDAQTLSQKYRAIALLCVDKEIAALYDMPVEEYNASLAKLYADVNDPSLKTFSEGLELKEAVNNFYNAAVENGREPLFWDAITTALVEQMYVASQNTDKFIAAFDDDSASSFTWYTALLTLAVEDLANANADYAPLNESLKPLVKINAINVEQFKEQLDAVKDELAVSHANILK